jgi:hypothetical protein
VKYGTPFFFGKRQITIFLAPVLDSPGVFEVDSLPVQPANTQIAETAAKTRRFFIRDPVRET